MTIIYASPEINTRTLAVFLDRRIQTLNNATHTWQAFDQVAMTTGSFGNFNSYINGTNQYAWSMVAFPNLYRCFTEQSNAYTHGTAT